MAEAQNQNQPNITLPQRSITITGAMSARLCQATIRASRIDLRSMQVAMAPPAVRDPSNRAIDRVMAAVARFEAELSAAEKDLDTASRSNSNRRGSGQNDNAQRRPSRDARPQAAGGDAAAAPTTSNNAAAGGQANASPNAQTKKRRKRNKNDGANNSQTAPAAKQPAVKPSGSTTAPASTHDSVAPVPTSADRPNSLTQQAVAPQADVPATIQAL